jgi:hypothetical protein
MSSNQTPGNKKSNVGALRAAPAFNSAMLRGLWPSSRALMTQTLMPHRSASTYGPSTKLRPPAQGLLAPLINSMSIRNRAPCLGNYQHRSVTLPNGASGCDSR